MFNVNSPELPPGLPLPALAQTATFWRAPHAYLEVCRRLYGRCFTIYPVSAAPMIFMSHPEDIASVISARQDVLHPGAGAKVIAPLVGKRSFMLQEGHDHLRVRKAIMPAFHHQAVAEHAETVRRIAAGEVATWPANQLFVAHPRLRALALRVILTTIFGEDDPRVSELHTRLYTMLAITGSLALQEPPLRAVLPWRRVWRSFLATRARVDELMLGLIDDEVHTTASESGVLSQLLAVHDGQHGDRGNVRDDLMSVILAGHETTASQLAWGLQLLAHDSTAMAVLTSEIDRADDDAYLTATIQEVMRHRPVFLFAIPRIVNKPLKVGRDLYAPPAQLVGCIHLLHHDPEWYREPHRFIPDRFIDSPPDSRFWLPWGGGRKRCPGHSLAMLEMQIVLQEVISQWSIAPAGRRLEPARWRSVIVTPGRGCKLLLARRGAVSFDLLKARRCHK
jgi:cytochrome P450